MVDERGRVVREQIAAGLGLFGSNKRVEYEIREHLLRTLGCDGTGARMLGIAPPLLPAGALGLPGQRDDQNSDCR